MPEKTEKAPIKPEDEAKQKAEEKDPVTNQPASDFQAKVPEDSPHAEAVQLQSDAMRLGNAMGRHAAATTLVETREREQQREEEAKAAGDISEQYPKADSTYAMIPPDVYRAREQARVMQEAATLGTSKTVPGGRFQVGDHFEDANGNRLEGDPEKEKK